MQRVQSIDIMKGISILLMMWCHLVGGHNQFVYSFHMPLFFLLAGFLSKDSNRFDDFKSHTLKNLNRLLLPYFVTMSMLCIWGVFQSVLKHDGSFFFKYFFSMIWASSDWLEFSWEGVTYNPYAGPLWFLWALFWCREIFYILQVIVLRYTKRRFFVVLITLIVSISILIIRKCFMIPLPLSFSQGVVALSFYSIGWYYKSEIINLWMIFLSLVCWALSIFFGSVELESCYMRYFPLELMGACGGTLVVYYLSSKLSIVPTKIISLLPRFLKWCGYSSLAILCMHTLEMYSGVTYSMLFRLPNFFRPILLGYGQILMAVLMAFLISHTPILKKVYYG